MLLQLWIIAGLMDLDWNGLKVVVKMAGFFELPG
jgi:hypothetical protein